MVTPNVPSRLQRCWISHVKLFQLTLTSLQSVNVHPLKTKVPDCSPTLKNSFFPWPFSVLSVATLNVGNVYLFSILYSPIWTKKKHTDDIVKKPMFSLSLISLFVACDIVVFRWCKPGLRESSFSMSRGGGGGGGQILKLIAWNFGSPPR